MSLKPLVNPLSLQANRATPANTHVPQFATLAGRVDRVTAHPRVLRAICNVQPESHVAFSHQTDPKLADGARDGVAQQLA
jgi:hypothetical protein